MPAKLMALIHGLASLAFSKVCRKSRNIAWSMPRISSSGAYALMKPRVRSLGLRWGRITGRGNDCASSVGAGGGYRFKNASVMFALSAFDFFGADGSPRVYSEGSSSEDAPPGSPVCASSRSHSFSSSCSMMTSSSAPSSCSEVGVLVLLSCGGIGLLLLFSVVNDLAFFLSLRAWMLSDARPIPPATPDTAYRRMLSNPPRPAIYFDSRREVGCRVEKTIEQRVTAVGLQGGLKCFGQHLPSRKSRAE